MKAHIIYIAAAAAMLSACSFLDRAPYDEVTSEAVYSDKDLAEAAVVGVYSNLRADYNSSALSTLNWDAFATVLDVYEAAAYSNYKFLLGSIQANDGSFLTYWKRFYEGINRANDVISNIDRVPNMTGEIKARRKAECQVLRAYHYYRLNCLWRGVPVYLENVAPAEYTRARSSEQDVWQVIIDDCTAAIECESLPAKYAKTNADYGRITKSVALMLRAKAYMWLKRWDLAETDLKQIGTNGFSLFNGSYADLFKEANEKCDEMIFSITMRDESGYGNVFSNTYGNFYTCDGGNSTFFANTRFVESYQWADGKPFSWDEVIPGYSTMSPKARSVYFLRDNMTETQKKTMEDYGADMAKYLATGNEARVLQAYTGRDPRLAATVITPYSTYSGGFTGAAVSYTLRWPYVTGDSAPYDLRTKSNSNFLYCIRKFVTVGTQYAKKDYNPVDVPVFRYAEVLLCLAECVNEQGGRINEAIGYVNQVRNRAGVAALNSGPAWLAVSGKDDLRKRIIDEKRWELACEEHLYNEELRWGVWKDDKFGNDNGLLEIWGAPVYKYSWISDKTLLWAIPQSEREKNRNLQPNPLW